MLGIIGEPTALMATMRMNEGNSLGDEERPAPDIAPEDQSVIQENPSPPDTAPIPLGPTPALKKRMALNEISSPTLEDGTTFLAICYHNVEDKNPDQAFVGVTTSKLINQLSWFKHNGYHPVSIDDIIAAREGRKPLPDKALLLTFDDGYVSFYTRVFPVLKAFHYPAVFALVGAWLEKGRPDDVVEYGDRKLRRSAFVTWDQVREMSQSGLVEIASHSYNLHRGIRANPQGNFEPAAVTREYDPRTHTYETEAAYERRIDADTALNVQKIMQETGKKPRIMVWPYGQYNQVAIDIQAKHAIPYTLTLDEGFGTIKNLRAVPRYLVNADPDMESFVFEIRNVRKTEPIRVVQVDLDYVYDSNPAQEAKNLDALISRIYAMKINTVYLQAFADPSGTGLARELYFPNRHLPMRQDLFNRVAWQLLTRAHVKVYAWMPVLAYDFGDAVAQVEAWDPETDTSEADPKNYRRVSPFDPAARRKILDIYEDLGRYAPIQGLLFHDDAMLSDFEDASDPALAAYARADLPASVEAIRADPDAMDQWAQLKIETLIAFTEELTEHVSRYRMPLKTARNIYAPAVLDKDSEDWFAQQYDRFLASYTYTAIEAMPEMENIPSDKSDDWLRQLEATVAQVPGGLQHTVFELQAVDWRKKENDSERRIPTAILGGQMRLLARLGALNFGYYPDDFITDHPSAKELHKDFSLQSYPYIP